jgi:3-hydroxyisobutyrate dehydrogenase-like beta-hydroxyacid dehydrogenase
MAKIGFIGLGIMGGFASSRILEVHGERLIKRNFNLGFASTFIRRISH